MKPRIHIFSPAFRYTSSANTDLRKTFAKARREQAKADEARKAAETNVRTLERKAKA